MDFIGVVCEYNPFHNGHLYHLNTTRAALGDLPVVCVLSGDFVQRGEAALYSKFARAEAAVRAGADAVFELPLPWSLSSAEGFARGAVGLLGALGASYLSFGAENENLEELDALAGALIEPQTVAEIRALMARETTLSFAAARERVLRDSFGPAAAALETPNNILAVEYLKAIREYCPQLQPFAVRRYGSAHDGTGEGAMKSASELRERMLCGASVEGFLPASAAAVLASDAAAGRGIPDRDKIETALLSRLRALPPEAFTDLPDASGGLGERLARAAEEEPSFDAVCAAVKNKRLALSRIRRAACCAALGVRQGMSDGLPPYARLLAATWRGMAVFPEIKRKTAIPLLTRPSAVRQLDEQAQRVFTIGAKAHDLYVLGYRAESERRGGADWRSSPILLDE